MKITSSQMYYKDYSWSTYGNDDPRITGKPDSTMFSRKEGYEVLYLINTYDLRNVNDAHKLEKMIRNELPSDVRSQHNVREWLSNNWSSSKY